METKNYIGIYLSKTRATVVCAGVRGKDRGVKHCFSVSPAEGEEANPRILATHIRRSCDERQVQFKNCEVRVALDCSMFMQHNMHSDFTDPRQIASTVRFDTEEVLATDVGNIAIAYSILSSSKEGSELTVFTAEKKVLSDLINALQSVNLDPVSVEPDAYCLSRFICENMSDKVDKERGVLYAFFSRQRAYLSTPYTNSGEGGTSGDKEPISLKNRTLLMSPQQDRLQLLRQQIPVTASQVKSERSIEDVFVFDSASAVDAEQLSELTGMSVQRVDVAESAGVSADTLADCDDLTEFAIAYGAAREDDAQSKSVNFRNDFMPYAGKRIRVEKALKFLCVSVTILLAALGLYLQIQLYQQNKPRARLRERFSKEYSIVMSNDKLPKSFKQAVKKLKSEENRIRQLKSGRLSASGEKSISAKLTLVLDAFNECSSETDLNIKKISLTSRHIRIVGDTRSRQSTLKLFGEIKKKLKILQSRYDSKGGRDQFSITASPKS